MVLKMVLLRGGRVVVEQSGKWVAIHSWKDRETMF